MENKRAKDIRIVEMAKKKRQIYLIEKLQSNKPLSRGEMKELDEYFGKKMPSGIVKTQEGLAKKLGVSLRTIGYWAKDGLPRTKQGFYDLKMVQDWRFSNDKRNKTKGFKKKDVDWESEYRKYKAKLAEMEWKEKKGQLVPVRDVERDNVRKIVVIKQKFLALPGIIAPQLVGLRVRKIEEVLRIRIEEIIDDFAQGRAGLKNKKDKLKY